MRFAGQADLMPESDYTIDFAVADLVTIAVAPGRFQNSSII